MAEYIERGALLAEYDRVHVGPPGGARKLIEEAPAADVVPVVHGRWIPCDPDSDVLFCCSECETEISTSWDYDCPEMWNYCPNCGARMDGDSDEG